MSPQETALKTKCHRCFWRNNGLAGFLDIDIENGLASDFAQSRLLSESGNEPWRVRCQREDVKRVSEEQAYHTVATPYLREVRTVFELGVGAQRALSRMRTFVAIEHCD